MKNFLKHLDRNVYPVSWLAILCAIMILPCIMFLPAPCGYENGLLENIQMVVLLIGFIMCFRAKENKKFFYFAALVIIIIALREVNCGRTLFFPVPGEVNAFYSWKEIKYGWLAHPLYGLYMAYVAFYFFKNKCYLPLKQYLLETKLPVINIILMLTGMVLGTYAEKASHNFVFEEISELLFYVSLVGIIYLYAFLKTKKV